MEPVQQKLHEYPSGTAYNKSQQLADAQAPAAQLAPRPPAHPTVVAATTSQVVMQPPPLVRHSSSPIMQQPQHNLSHQRPSAMNAHEVSAMPAAVQCKPILQTAAANRPSAARGGKKLWAPGAKDRRPVKLIDRNEVIAASKVPLATQPAPVPQPKPTGVVKTPRPRGRPKGSKNKTPSAPHQTIFKTTPRVTPGVGQHKSPVEKPSMAQLFSTGVRLPSFRKQPSANTETSPTAEQRSLRKGPSTATDACEEGDRLPSLGDDLSDMDIDGDSDLAMPCAVLTRAPIKQHPDKTQVFPAKSRPIKPQSNFTPEPRKQHDNASLLTKTSVPPAKPVVQASTSARVPVVALEMHTAQGVKASAGPANSIAATTTPETPARTPVHASACDDDKVHSISRSLAGKITPIAFRLGNSLAGPQHEVEPSPLSWPGSASHAAPLPAAEQSAMTSMAATASSATTSASEEASSSSATTSTTSSASASSCDDSRAADEATSGPVVTSAESPALQPLTEALAASPITDKPAECQRDCVLLTDAPDSIIRLQSGPAAGKCYALNFTRNGTKVFGICSSEKEAVSALKAQHSSPADAASLSEESASSSEQWSESDAPSEVSSRQHSDHGPESEGDSGERVLPPRDVVVAGVNTADAGIAEQPCTTAAVDLEATELEGMGDEPNSIGLKETAHALPSVASVLDATIDSGGKPPTAVDECTTEPCAMQSTLKVEVESIKHETKTKLQLEDTGLKQSTDLSSLLARLDPNLFEAMAQLLSSEPWCTGREAHEQPCNLQNDAKGSVSPALAGSSQPIAEVTQATTTLTSVITSFEHKCDTAPSADAAAVVKSADLETPLHAHASADRVEGELVKPLNYIGKDFTTTTCPRGDLQPASSELEAPQERIQLDAAAALEESEVRMHNMCSAYGNVVLNSQANADICPATTSLHVDVERMEEQVVVVPEPANDCSPAQRSRHVNAVTTLDESKVHTHNACSVSPDNDVERMQEQVAVVPEPANYCSPAQQSARFNAVTTLDESEVHAHHARSISHDAGVSLEADADVRVLATSLHTRTEAEHMKEGVACEQSIKRSSSSLPAQPLDRRKRLKLDLNIPDEEHTASEQVPQPDSANYTMVDVQSDDHMEGDKDMGHEQALQADTAVHTMSDIQTDGQHDDELEASSSEDTEIIASEATEATEVLSTHEDVGDAFTSPPAGAAMFNEEVDSPLHADANKGVDTLLATPSFNTNELDGIASEALAMSDRRNNVASTSQSAKFLPPKSGYRSRKGMGTGYAYEVRGSIWRATFNFNELGSSPVFRNSVQAELGFLLGLAAIELFEDLPMRKQFVRKAFEIVPDCEDDIPSADASSSSTAASCIELQGRLIELGKVLSFNEIGSVEHHWRRRRELRERSDAQHAEPVAPAPLDQDQMCMFGKRPRGQPRKDGSMPGQRLSYADVDRNPSLRPYYECSVATQLLQLLTEEARRQGWTLPPDL